MEGLSVSARPAVNSEQYCIDFRDVLCVNTGPVFYSYSHSAGLGVEDCVQGLCTSCQQLPVAFLLDESIHSLQSACRSTSNTRTQIYSVWERKTHTLLILI